MRIKLIIILLLLTPFLSGCLTYAHAYKTRKMLPRFQEGQSKNDVLDLMKHLPDKIERYEYKGALYEVWFYNIQEHYTDTKTYMPLVFKNKILIGWGYEFYNKTLKDY